MICRVFGVDPDGSYYDGVEIDIPDGISVKAFVEDLEKRIYKPIHPVDRNRN